MSFLIIFVSLSTQAKKLLETEYKIPNKDSEKKLKLTIKMKNENTYMCPVCDNLTELKLECGHYLCTKCKEKWFKKQKTCPICRHIVSNDQTNVHIVDILYEDVASDDDENTITYFADTEELRTSIRFAQSFRVRRNNRQRILRERYRAEWSAWWCSIFQCFSL